ncbi:MAG: IS1380 family transposase [Acidobacteria bacterium]|nr:MAG: IS1380 family transposase [Acidobacteriota bacterium]
MNTKIQDQIELRKRRIARRLERKDLRGCERPIMTSSNIHYEIAERVRVTAAGGIGAIHLLARKLGLDRAIDERLSLLKMHLPYHESDHVFSIAYNLLAGGECLEHLEYLRSDEAFLDALGARRIPDPTTAGDFCRRFEMHDIIGLMEVFNATREKVWRQQPKAFFEQAIIEADGTMVETTGECKQGMDINHKGQWGYHPLLLSLANTGEPLYVVNRSGNRPSHEHAAIYFDRAIALCRRAGFRKILLRGDTDFTQTAHLDRWDDAGEVRFIFGIDAMPNLYEIVENLPKTAWKELKRPAKYAVKTRPRCRPQNVKEQVVREREFENIRLAKEYVAEFSYQPAKCRKPYRIVVVWKDLEVSRGQQKLFDDSRCFFYITNDEQSPPEKIVLSANDRCNQENLLQQLKSGVRSFSAPLDNLLSNWAYMVMASLAWSLKAWSALLLPESVPRREKRQEEKRRLLRMDFATFRRALMQVPAQVLRTSRKIVCRLLAWNPWQEVFFRLLEQIARPLRC